MCSSDISKKPNNYLSLIVPFFGLNTS
jgi:hypothetical protein